MSASSFFLSYTDWRIPNFYIVPLAVFLARSHDSTILFTYSPPSSSVLDPEDLGCERSTSAKFAFGVGHELKTRDTEHEAHIDACVGHTINETLRQFIVLNAQGQLWRVSGIGDHGSLKRVGKISRITPDRLAWGRCGIYPSNDTLVVGLRDSVSIVDYRVNRNHSFPSNRLV